MIAILLALACGSERVAVKQLRDAPELATQKATVTTIAALRALPAIAWHNQAPRTDPERQVVGVAAWMVGFKLEADSDWHVVIRDKDGHTMIVELPDPDCAVTASVRAAFTKAREQFLAVVGQTPTKSYRVLANPIPVAVAGPVFLDKLHHQTGVAKNGVEIHPVTFIARRRAK
jgi:hypothetical protein